MWELTLDFNWVTSLQKIANVIPTAAVMQIDKVHGPLVKRLTRFSTHFRLKIIGTNMSLVWHWKHLWYRCHTTVEWKYAIFSSMASFLRPVSWNQKFYSATCLVSVKFGRWGWGVSNVISNGSTSYMCRSMLPFYMFTNLLFRNHISKLIMMTPWGVHVFKT